MSVGQYLHLELFLQINMLVSSGGFTRSLTIRTLQLQESVRSSPIHRRWVPVDLQQPVQAVLILLVVSAYDFKGCDMLISSRRTAI
jgi:hypothetical protein